MVDIAYGAGSNGSEPEWNMRSLQAVDDPRRHLDRLVPLLHELITWDLVHQAADGSFVLREDVQLRLAALTADRPVRSAQVYVGRKCQHCDRVTLTRMVDGMRICSACARAALLPDTVVAPAPEATKGRGRFHRHRRAS